jgi:CrcB protein
MERLFLVFVGGGAGAVARYGLGLWLPRPAGWPLPTLTANVAGGLLIGILAGFLAHRGGEHQQQWQLLLQVGVLGGFTTFSAFSLETAMMIERKALVQAAGYAGLSVALCIAAVFAGLMLSRRVFA